MSERLPKPRVLYSVGEVARAFDDAGLEDLASQLAIAGEMCDGRFLTGLEPALEHIRGVVAEREVLTEDVMSRASQLAVDIEAEHRTAMSEAHELAHSFVSDYPGVLVVSEKLAIIEGEAESEHIVEDIVLRPALPQGELRPAVVIEGRLYDGPSLRVGCDIALLPDDLRSRVEPNLLELNT